MMKRNDEKKKDVKEKNGGKTLIIFIILNKMTNIGLRGRQSLLAA